MAEQRDGACCRLGNWTSRSSRARRQSAGAETVHSTSKPTLGPGVPFAGSHSSFGSGWTDWAMILPAGAVAGGPLTAWRLDGPAGLQNLDLPGAGLGSDTHSALCVAVPPGAEGHRLAELGDGCDLHERQLPRLQLRPRASPVRPRPWRCPCDRDTACSRQRPTGRRSRRPCGRPTLCTFDSLLGFRTTSIPRWPSQWA